MASAANSPVPTASAREAIGFFRPRLSGGHSFAFRAQRWFFTPLENFEGRAELRENLALAAALVHDVGHGPFSHAFEKVGMRLGLSLANHEHVSDLLIRHGEIAEILNEMEAKSVDVADMVKKEGCITVHNAVVSSQFDADRLDYMRRDRLMTGTQHSGIDFVWLMANLKIATVPTGVMIKTMVTENIVIGSKAIHAAEAYVLGLFQRYPTVYFHKATRGAEKLFTELLVRLVTLCRDGSAAKTGLSSNHPLVAFASNPEGVEAVLRLDDAVVTGSLAKWSMLRTDLSANTQRGFEIDDCTNARQYAAI